MLDLNMVKLRERERVLLYNLLGISRGIIGEYEYCPGGSVRNYKVSDFFSHSEPM